MPRVKTILSCLEPWRNTSPGTFRLAFIRSRLLRLSVLASLVVTVAAVFVVAQSRPSRMPPVDIGVTLSLMLLFLTAVTSWWYGAFRQSRYMTAVTATGGLALCVGISVLPEYFSTNLPRPDRFELSTVCKCDDASHTITRKVGWARHARRVWIAFGVAAFAALLYLIKVQSKLWFGVAEVVLSGIGGTMLNPKFANAVQGDGDPLKDPEPWLIMLVAVYGMVKGFENIGEEWKEHLIAPKPGEAA